MQSPWYIKRHLVRKERLKVNELSIQLQKLDRGQQKKPKESRREKKRTEINRIKRQIFNRESLASQKLVSEN